MTDSPLPLAVLWDLDGTLIDSEPAWIGAEYELVESFGGTWSDELAHTIVGWQLVDSAAFIAANSPVTLPVERIVEELVGRVVASLRRRVPWRPGALELLAALRAAGVRTALVTMSYAVLADAVVAALPVGVGFDVVVTGDRVVHGKPHPEPYRIAVAELGVPPERAVVLEDSPSGIASAVAAGIPTLGIPNVVDLPARDGVRLVPTLAGLTPHDLALLAPV